MHSWVGKQWLGSSHVRDSSHNMNPCITPTCSSPLTETALEMFSLRTLYTFTMSRYIRPSCRHGHIQYNRHTPYSESILHKFQWSETRCIQDQPTYGVHRMTGCLGKLHQHRTWVLGFWIIRGTWPLCKANVYIVLYYWRVGTNRNTRASCGSAGGGDWRGHTHTWRTNGCPTATQALTLVLRM